MSLNTELKVYILKRAETDIEDDQAFTQPDNESLSNAPIRSYTLASHREVVLFISKCKTRGLGRTEPVNETLILKEPNDETNGVRLTPEREIELFRYSPEHISDVIETFSADQTIFYGIGQPEVIPPYGKRNFVCDQFVKVLPGGSSVDKDVETPNLPQPQLVSSR